jgi:hypothetical protein
VPHQNVANAVVAEQLIVDRQHRATRVAEDEFDTLADQAFDQYRSAAAFLRHVSIPLQNATAGKKRTRHDCSRAGSLLSNSTKGKPSLGFGC